MVQPTPADGGPRTYPLGGWVEQAMDVGKSSTNTDLCTTSKLFRREAPGQPDV